jgi:hypothetical protein
LGGIKPFAPDQDDRRLIRPRECEVRVKIMVERYACAALFSRTPKNLFVACPLQTDFGYVDRVPAIRPKQSRRLGRETLIQ